MRALRLGVVLVEPEGGVNLGLIARLVRNFEADELVLVNPRLGEEGWRLARIFAARARDIVDSARICSSLGEAISGYDFVVATSAVCKVEGPNILRRPITLDELVRMISERGYRNLAVVFGRESTGLTNEEIAMCDLLLTIEASPSYPTLNVANSVAIILYKLYKELSGSEIRRRAAERHMRDKLIEYFKRALERVISDEYGRARALQAFKNVVNRGQPDDRETAILVRAFRKISEGLKRASS